MSKRWSDGQNRPKQLAVAPKMGSRVGISDHASGPRNPCPTLTALSHCQYKIITYIGDYQNPFLFPGGCLAHKLINSPTSNRNISGTPICHSLAPFQVPHPM